MGRSNIDRPLLPVKIHYFLFNSAIGCALPFRSVFAKQLGISATAIGVIFCTMPFMKMLTNPLFGFLLDFSKKFRLILSLIMIFIALSHISMVFIPSKSSMLQDNINFTQKIFYSKLNNLSTNESSQSSCYSKLRLEYNLSQSSVSKTNSFICDIQCSKPKNSTKNQSKCHIDINSEFKIFTRVSDCGIKVKLEKGQLEIIYLGKQTLFLFEGDEILARKVTPSISQSKNCSSEKVLMIFPSNIYNEKENKFEGRAQPKEVNTSEFVIENVKDETVKILDSNVKKYHIQKEYIISFSNEKLCVSNPCSIEFNCNVHKCSINVEEIENNLEEYAVEENEFLSVQFRWIFILMLASSVVLAAVIFIMDTVCYELLQERKEKYGQQRLWGTVGWGLGALIGGSINQLVTSDSEIIDYGPSFYMLAALALIDLIPLYHLKVTDLKYSSHICKDACFLFFKVDIIYNVFIVFSVGVLSGFMWHYQFWFMEEIGSSQVLLGLSQIFESMFEVPSFFVSGWIISKIGHGHCNSITLLCFGLRYLCFTFMYNPWWTLAAALLHGPTFGLFYASMTMYAKNEAPPGTEATIQSLLHLCFEGIGVAAGSLLGGIGIDKVGSRTCFTYAAGMSFILVFVNFSVSIYLSKMKKESKQISVISDSMIKL